MEDKWGCRGLKRVGGQIKYTRGMDKLRKGG